MNDHHGYTMAGDIVIPSNDEVLILASIRDEVKALRQDMKVERKLIKEHREQMGTYAKLIYETIR